MSAWICKAWSDVTPGEPDFYLSRDEDVKKALVNVHSTIKATHGTRIAGLRQMTVGDAEVLGKLDVSVRKLTAEEVTKLGLPM